MGHFLFWHPVTCGWPNNQLSLSHANPLLAGRAGIWIFSEPESNEQCPRTWGHYDLRQRVSSFAGGPATRMDVAGESRSGLLGADPELFARRNYLVLCRDVHLALPVDPTGARSNLESCR